MTQPTAQDLGGGRKLLSFGDSVSALYASYPDGEARVDVMSIDPSDGTVINGAGTVYATTMPTPRIGGSSWSGDDPAGIAAWMTRVEIATAFFLAFSLGHEDPCASVGELLTTVFPIPTSAAVR